METIFKELKGGSSTSMITSEVEFELGMQVEEEFHNEINPINGQVEKGNKLLRFFKTIYQSKLKKESKIPIVICKYEMLGIRDNYKTDTAVESDYDDEEDDDSLPTKHSPTSYYFTSTKKRKSPSNVSKKMDKNYTQSYQNANAFHFSSTAATNSGANAAMVASKVNALTSPSIQHGFGANLNGNIAAAGGGNNNRNGGGFLGSRKQPNLAVATKNYNVVAANENDFEDATDGVENMYEDDSLL